MVDMIYSPQKYSIPDISQHPFIDAAEIIQILRECKSDPVQVREIIQKSLEKQRLSLQETAILLQTSSPDLKAEIKAGAKLLKEKVYGERIVLFAPLYVGNHCINNCSYCGFRVSNKEQLRTTLSQVELIEEVKALEATGQKRLILVYGEHPAYSADFIAETVRTVYQVRHGSGEIRRININAAPLDIEGFRKVREAGIGTYQIFQETYHEETYRIVHPSGKKHDFNWRLTSLDRAMEAGIDDVGIGALLGLYDWKFDVLGLLRHVNHLEAAYHVGPHTISFPRIKAASGNCSNPKYAVSDDDFTLLVAILRLAVPYTGLILTAREPAFIRDEIMSFGISQIDGGTNIQLKGYANQKDKQDLNKEQFQINDYRTLNEIVDELIDKQFLPSFCTSCYRTGRTGEHFMEFSVPGFIKKLCQPNAILTLAEYLEDYATPDTKKKGYDLIHKKMEAMENNDFRRSLGNKLTAIQLGKRDLYF